MNCFYDESRSVAKVVNFTKVLNDEEIIKRELVTHGPLSVAIDVYPLQFYKGGVIQGKSC
ncbi:MAG: C1 family peptidase [bacterium]